MKISLFYLSLSVAAGIAIGVFLKNGDEPSAAADVMPVQIAAGGTDSALIANAYVEDLNADIDRLSQQLEDEISARQTLEQKLADLVFQVETLVDSSHRKDAYDSGEEDTVNPEEKAVHRNSDWFNEQALFNAGLESIQIRELSDFFEQQELDQLYLRDQSIREGWSREQFRDAIQAITSKEEELKTRIGESAYDAYLYATGRSNRVVVTNVLANAQAGVAGILSGDQIIRYGNQRIYNQFDLRDATTGGDINESVTLEIIRNGETMEFFLVRGPLGIRMNSLRVAP